jgi:zinc transporter, ZIP family
MWNALLWGAVGGSSVFIGALIGIYCNVSHKVTGIIMAFGTGTLIGAASFDLMMKSVEKGGIKTTLIGYILGAAVFTISNMLIAKRGGHERKKSIQNSENHSGIAIFIGTIIDAIPESIIIGVSLIDHGSVGWLLLIAVFISNFPEGMSSSIGLQKGGYSKGKILLMWAFVLLLASLSSLGGYYFLENASATITSAIGAFAAGGIIAMVSATMMPEAYKEGGSFVGFISAIGLLLSLVLSYFEK